jgi:hypothetical protein
VQSMSQVGGSAGTRYRLRRQAWALSLLFVFAILGAVLHAGVAQAANPWATPERPYPHTRATAQRMIYGHGTLSGTFNKLSGTFNKYVRVELWQFYRNSWHRVGHADSGWTNEYAPRLIATVKCGGANQSYLWFTSVHGWNHFNGYLGSKDSGIVRHHC